MGVRATSQWLSKEEALVSSFAIVTDSTMVQRATLHLGEKPRDPELFEGRRDKRCHPGWNYNVWCEFSLTFLKEATDRQQVFNSQDPDTPWHLQSWIMVFSKSWKKEGIKSEFLFISRVILLSPGHFQGRWSTRGFWGRNGKKRGLMVFLDTWNVEHSMSLSQKIEGWSLLWVLGEKLVHITVKPQRFVQTSSSVRANSPPI